MNSKKLRVLFSNETKPPNCAHGPTLLFERYSIGNEKQTSLFYACSACRDRKDCNFFCWADDFVPSHNENQTEDKGFSQNSNGTCINHNKRITEIKNYSSEEIKFCANCNKLLLKSEWVEHARHRIIESVDVNKPSLYFMKLESNKKEAQYLFTDKSVDRFLDFIRDLNFTHVLCIGTPRIHEELKIRNAANSLLLDIDSRYNQFDIDSTYCEYNMFNHHFFNGDLSKKLYHDFLEDVKCDQSGSILILMDPPFGGLLQVLAHTISTITSDWKNIHGNDKDCKMLSTILFYPYFHEKMLVDHFPGFSMSDYQVEYSNHKSFNNSAKGRKYGSPIRMFTNLDLSKLKLPTSEGYKYCEICEKYVKDTNNHCERCNICPSKDGRPYTHCDICNACCKSSWKHCLKCNICVITDHDCDSIRVMKGCFKCGDFSHKFKECPQKDLVIKKASLKRVNRKHFCQKKKKKRIS